MKLNRSILAAFSVFPAQAKETTTRVFLNPPNHAMAVITDLPECTNAPKKGTKS